MAKDIDLILPCFNPPPDFPDVICEYFRNLKRHFSDRTLNLYVVNDGSIVNFTEIEIKKLLSGIESVQIISYPVNKGKGYALRKGVAETMSPLVVYTDYDFPFGIETMINLVEVLDKGADIVLISRDREYYKVLPPLRRFYSKSSRLLNQYILGLEYPEAQGGLKGFNSNGKDIFMKTTIDEFLFDTEFIFRALKEKHISIVSIQGNTRKGIRPNRIPLRVLRKEILNFFKIFSLRIHGYKGASPVPVN